MRQAGRCLPEYRALKEKHGFLGLMTDPALAAEVTLQPMRRFPYDAAILFSDIMTPVMGMGVGLSFDPGPVLPRPIRTRADVEALRPLDPARDCGFVAETLRRVKPALPAGAALLGFAGSPFTVASYLVEGRGGGEGAAARRMLREDPATLDALLRRLADATAAYLRMQVEAGADAVQVFDTWGGVLTLDEWREHALPPLRRAIEGAAGVPAILYAGAAPHLLAAAAESGATAVSIHHGTPLDEARRALPAGIALQGNLDPEVLLGPVDRVAAETARVVRLGGPRGYVFNLGHGIRPDTPIEAVDAMLAAVRR
jgi:uroporphyrinogen decarboxylase